MYYTLIAGGGRTVAIPFVVHLQRVWRKVNAALIGFRDSLLKHGMDAVLSSTHPII